VCGDDPLPPLDRPPHHLGRLVSDCHDVMVYTLMWTSQKRCSFILNSRRWRCKQPPTHLVLAGKEGEEKRPGAAYCAEHLEALRCEPQEAAA
jgi:hypothetical protein